MVSQTGPQTPASVKQDDVARSRAHGQRVATPKRGTRVSGVRSSRAHRTSPRPGSSLQPQRALSTATSGGSISRLLLLAADREPEPPFCQSGSLKSRGEPWHTPRPFLLSTRLTSGFPLRGTVRSLAVRLGARFREQRKNASTPAANPPSRMAFRRLEDSANTNLAEIAPDSPIQLDWASATVRELSNRYDFSSKHPITVLGTSNVV